MQEVVDRIVLKCGNVRCRGRFLAEFEGDYQRCVCPSCGAEVVYRSKKLRQEDGPVDTAARPG